LPFFAFGIVVGSLFRGLFLLNDLRKRLSMVLPTSDKVKATYADKPLKNWIRRQQS
jgi:hypothetical protein